MIGFNPAINSPQHQRAGDAEFSEAPMRAGRIVLYSAYAREGHDRD